MIRFRHGYIATLGICALTTALALPWHAAIDPANVILLYVLATAICAVLWGRGPAVLASFLSVPCFNFFFVPPRFSLSVDNPQYLLTFAVMLVVSLLVGYLSNAYRAKAEEAGRRAVEAEALQALSRALSASLNAAQLAGLLGDFLRQRGLGGATLFLPDNNERLQAVSNQTSIVELTAVQGVYVSGQATGVVAELHGGDGAILLPLEGSTRRRGVLAVHVPLAAESPEATLMAALATLTATAVERIHFVDVARQAELEAAGARLRTSILSAVSHDIRTPLTVLYGLADQIACGEGDASTAVALRDQTGRLHRMVDNLLDMARLKSGRVTLRRDWQALPEIAAAAAQSLGQALAGHRLRFDWPGDLPLLRLDAALMERVFCNLLENAAKYSPSASEIVLGARCMPDSVEVAVDNGGAGFPPERIARAFELFERGVDESPIPGVGIGLSICRTIVEAHGGRIEAINLAEGTVPGGARVRFTLPLEAVPEMPAESEPEHG